MKKFWLMALALGVNYAWAQDIRNNPGSNHGNKFEQLGTILPTPNEYRTASGAPGPKYWQQRADYDIRCELDEVALRLKGSETITYFNNSPDELRYLWLQLDENQHSATNNANYQDGSTIPPVVTDQYFQKMEDFATKGLGVNIEKVTDGAGKDLSYTINRTMMRVDLPVVLKPGEKYVLKIDWNYKIPDRMSDGGRGGYEFFKEDGNHIFTITQWFPRMCVYSDFQGWQHQQFTGRGEFALTFGNYKVQMTVPADHIVGATGECLNYPQVLSPTQQERWKKAQTAKEPVEIVTLNDAKIAEGKKAAGKKTWIFKADNVRDFAWTSSRKFIWDAMPTYIEGKKVMCMSFYGKEAYGLYRPYSTKAVAHTIRVYSKYTIPYPYPVAQSVEAANGMEYPMICFNYGRTEKDGTYTESTKNGMLGVIFHEVGHNFFPMIINSDERQWSWMDEGLNTFVQYLTESEWDDKFPSRRGPAYLITDYMKLPKDQLEPIMTNSDNIVQFGPNAYAKPATGLNILRETIMGRKLFDFAFKEYARRWAFKHPTPADFFRTMEDASAEDLDWFWRGWFYGIDPCDISIDTVIHAVPDFSGVPPKGTTGLARFQPQLLTFDDISRIRNREDKSIQFQTDLDPSLRDFYWRYARGLEKIDTTPQQVVSVSQFAAADEEMRKKYGNKHFYQISFSNKGGLVMPLIIEWNYTDGTQQTYRIPAQVWRKNEESLTMAFVHDKEVRSIVLDPLRETADIDESNNYWPRGTQPTPSRFRMFKENKSGGVRGQSSGVSPMQRAQKK